MILFGDYHTHTIFSHGKGTIEDNVKVAVAKGLKQVAITDHGLNHLMFGVSRKKLIKMREEVERLKKIYPIEILLGVEANLISGEGDIDVPADVLPQLDFVIAGYHQTALPKNIHALFDFYIPNWFGVKSEARKLKNTMSYVKMLEKNPYLTCVVHLNYACAVNSWTIAEKAKEIGTYIELNGKRTLFSPYEVSMMVKNETKFLMNSDAHISSRVGETILPYNFMLKNGIPEELVCNLNQLPEIKRTFKNNQEEK